MSTCIDHALAMSVVATLSACAGPAGPPPVSETDTENVNVALAVPPREAGLAEQAQRDVEQLRRLDRSRAPTTGGDAEAVAQRPKIQWIQPGSRRAAPTEPPARSGHRTTAAAVTGDGEEAPGVQEALGRDRSTVAEASLDEPGGGTPAPVPESSERDRLRNQIVELSSELYRRAAYSDMPLRELLLIAATTLVTPDRALATDALPGVTDREREILGHWQAFCARVGPKLAETGDPEVLVAEIDALHRQLARQPQLVVAQASLCTRVGGFGDYDEFPRNSEGRYAFLAHNGQQAVVYVEIEDFSSEPNEQGQWVTQLSQQLVVISERDGIPVWREDWQAGVDLSRKRREDFFIVQVVTLPERLSVGRYNLKIRIRDDRSGAEAETAIDFEMVADPRMAGGQ
ncbi:MAG: hypothetical protein ACYSWT_13695 [Planctomycetota bacterium]